MLASHTPSARAKDGKRRFEEDGRYKKERSSCKCYNLPYTIFDKWKIQKYEIQQPLNSFILIYDVKVLFLKPKLQIYSKFTKLIDC